MESLTSIFKLFEGPRTRPIAQTERVSDLSAVMEERDKNGMRTHAAAFVENPLSDEEQGRALRLVADKDIRKKMSYYSNAKNVTDNSLEKTFENILAIIHTKHSSGSDARLQMEAALSTLYTEITETLRAFPGYELGSFSIRYAAPKWLDSGSQLEGFHPDIAILTGDHGEEIVDQEPTEENLRVVRTVVGPSTEYLLGTNKTQDEVLTPAPGSTCVHATPSFTLHRQPHTKRGDVRFAYVLDLKKV